MISKNTKTNEKVAANRRKERRIPERPTQPGGPAALSVSLVISPVKCGISAFHKRGSLQAPPPA